MTDNGLAALAAALRSIPVPATYEEWQSRMDASYEADAAAILAALPPDFLCGHLAHEEFARLRKIEEAARALFDGFYGPLVTYEGGHRGMTQLDHGYEEYEARMDLRAALGEKP